MQIDKNSVVSFHYSVATTEGEAVDKSQAGEPLVYLHGHGQIVPGLEAVMKGKAAGAKFSATIAPKDAYGEHDAELDLRMSAAT